MKTRLIIFSIIILSVVSCTSDRDDDAKMKAIDEKTNNVKLKKIDAVTTPSANQATSKNDTIIVRSLNSSGDGESIDPADGGDPKDVPIPPRR